MSTEANTIDSNVTCNHNDITCKVLFSDMASDEQTFLMKEMAKHHETYGDIAQITPHGTETVRIYPAEGKRIALDYIPSGVRAKTVNDDGSLTVVRP